MFEQAPRDRPGALRLIAAFVAMPCVSAAVGAVLFPALNPEIGESADDAVLRYLVLSGVVGLLVTLFLAVPIVVAELRRGPVSPARAAILGALAGNAPFAMYLVVVFGFAVVHLVEGTLWDRMLPLTHLLVATLRLVAIGATMGAASAVTFWWIALRGTAAST